MLRERRISNHSSRQRARRSCFVGRFVFPCFVGTPYCPLRLRSTVIGGRTDIQDEGWIYFVSRFARVSWIFHGSRRFLRRDVAHRASAEPGEIRPNRPFRMNVSTPSYIQSLKPTKGSTVLLRWSVCVSLLRGNAILPFAASFNRYRRAY